MKSVNDHLERAIEELEMAHGKAPMGTRMMIRDLLDDTEALAERVANIIEEEDDGGE